MDKLMENSAIANLPLAELTGALDDFLAPMLEHLPDKRLRVVATSAVQAITGSQSPVLAEMARSVAREESTVWPTAKRFYRFVENRRFSHRHLLKGLYATAQRTVAACAPDHLVVALDPVNFEKPYTKKLEGVSTVMKSTPPGPRGEKRLTPGYPAMTATVVNLPVPVISYANWFSYKTEDFVSENREIYRAIRTTRALFPSHILRFVGDAGLDDQKVFHQVAQVHGQFIIRASHLHRLVEVYNDRLDRWECEKLSGLTSTVPFRLRLRVIFTHARMVRVATVRLGWLRLRLPESGQELWALIACDSALDREVVLLTNIPITTADDAQTIYTEWRYRPRLEHVYRFEQEDGLDIEDVRVRTLERMRRVFVLVLLTALFVYHIGTNWPHKGVLWLRRLGGKLGLSSDLDGPYILLAGIHAVFVTAATLTFAARHPFPHEALTCG